MNLLLFYLGVVVGTFLGVGFMCLLALGREPASKEELAPRR